MRMRWSASLIALLIGGCIRIDPPALVSSTQIPGSSITVDLLGPNEKGHYCYDVKREDGGFIPRHLGRPAADDLPSTTIETLHDGNVRIQWGTGEYATFCVIDVDDELVVDDYRMANMPEGMPKEPESFARPSDLTRQPN